MMVRETIPKILFVLRLQVLIYSDPHMTILLRSRFEYFGYIFPECVARVPVSLWGSGG